MEGARREDQVASKGSVVVAGPDLPLAAVSIPPSTQTSHKKEWFSVQPALLAYTIIRHRVRPDAYCCFGAGLGTNCGQERRRDLQIRVSGPALGRLDAGFLRRPRLPTKLLPAARAHHTRRRYWQRHQLFRRNRRSAAGDHAQEPGCWFHPTGRDDAVASDEGVPD